LFISEQNQVKKAMKSLGSTEKLNSPLI
jgi:hypothetical protein